MNEFLLYYKDFLFYFHQYLDRYAFLFPIGIIGIWRWSVWSGKEIIGLNYKPKTKEYKATVSIVTPVYNEDPKIFTDALNSWATNNPMEIIAVIDYTDAVCIQIFKTFQKKFSGAKLVVTRIPGKRPALAIGIKKAKGEIVALVDSDTLWDKDVIRNGLPPFHDKKVAGVATYQSVLNAKTFAQKIFDVQLDLRYRHEYPFLAAVGNALVCLSGRTAFYRRSVVVPMLYDLVNETFRKKPVISGDDKRLTYLVLKAGWKVAYQSNSHVYTPGMADLKSYLKQRLRWTRNSLRADLGAIKDGWPIKHPGLLFFQIDKLLQSFVIILSPIFFLVALFNHLWLAAGVIMVWWGISRTIKMYPHLLHKPHNFSIVPGYIIYSFTTGITKIYAFFTLNTQGWITRWDKSRLPQLRFLTVIPGYLGTASVLLLLTYAVYMYKQHTYFIPLSERKQILTQALLPMTQKASAQEAVLGASNTTMKQLFVTKYQAKRNETLSSIAKKFEITEQQLYNANAAKLPFGQIMRETILSIPGKDMELAQQAMFKVSNKPTELTVAYDKKTNSLLVTGRGKTVTLKDIQNRVGKKYLVEETPKVWNAKASLILYHGVTLKLSRAEVMWLKLESNKNGFTMLRAINGDILIDGVKITSWDSEEQDYDKNLKDGRSFVMVKDNSRMDIYDSELAYLGYATSPELSVSPYGVSWKSSSLKLKKIMLTGEVKNSKFHHNYFGTYTYGATGMLWQGNEFYENVRYGLDPHDDSNGFLVEENYAHNNGTHGIIFSKRCMYNTIRNNVSINNKLHGIMLHELSDNNVVENNVLTGNTSGIALWHSSNNIVRNNTLENNRHGIRANFSSDENIFENNTISNSKLYGFYLYDKANKNVIQNNTLNKNAVAMYIKSNENNIHDNILTNNAVGIYFVNTASKNVVVDNQIKQSAIYGVYIKVAEGINNIAGNNTLSRNRKDIVGRTL